MIRLIVVLTTSFLWSNMMSAQSLSAIELIEKIRKAHDSDNKRSVAKNVSFDYVLYLLPPVNLHLISRETTELGSKRNFQFFPVQQSSIGFDGQSAWSTENHEGNPPNHEVNYHYYFLNLPWLLKVDDVEILSVGKDRLPIDQLSGDKYTTLNVRLKEEVGGGSTDYFKLFIDDGTYLVKAIEYTVSYASLLDNMRLSKEVERLGPYIHVIENNQTIEGMVYPSEMSTYSAGVQIAKHTIYNISFNDSFDEKLFEVPENGVVDTSISIRNKSRH